MIEAQPELYKYNVRCVGTDSPDFRREPEAHWAFLATVRAPNFREAIGKCLDKTDTIELLNAGEGFAIYQNPVSKRAYYAGKFKP